MVLITKELLVRIEDLDKGFVTWKSLILATFLLSYLFLKIIQS